MTREPLRANPSGSFLSSDERLHGINKMPTSKHDYKLLRVKTPLTEADETHVDG